MGANPSGDDHFRGRFALGSPGCLGHGRGDDEAAASVEKSPHIRIALASCCPEAETFSLVAFAFETVRIVRQRGADAPRALARISHPTNGLRKG